jgi:hypothetical protein
LNTDSGNIFAASGEVMIRKATNLAEYSVPNILPQVEAFDVRSRVTAKAIGQGVERTHSKAALGPEAVSTL